MASVTVAQRFGPFVADELARLAIDLACAAPSHDGTTVAVKVPWRLIREARAVLERAGVDWYEITRARELRDREERGRAYAERHGIEDA